MIKNTVDMVCLALHEGVLHVLLIKRGRSAFVGKWALPGGHVEEGESLKAAAIRELEEETGISPGYRAIQIGTFGDPNRDPRGHVIGTAFMTLFQQLQKPKADDDAVDARWFPLEKIEELAFDHRTVIELALTKIKIECGSRLEEGEFPLWLNFCPLALTQDCILSKTLEG